VLDFARSCPALQRLHYVSTCYVSGRLPGTFGEGDLLRGQSFNNFYEETKFLAEVDVQEQMRAGLPVTIYRPAIVVGDSQTGVTQKFDGPYFVIQWILRQPKLALVPVVGKTTATHLNVVPRNFVVQAIAHLSTRDDTANQVFQLADPEPLTVDEMLTVLGAASGRRLVRIPLPVGLAKASIRHVPGVYPLLRIPASAIDYFVHPTTYATTNAQAALQGSGISVPPFASYASRLVEFARQHPEIGSSPMI